MNIIIGLKKNFIIELMVHLWFVSNCDAKKRLELFYKLKQ